MGGGCALSYSGLDHCISHHIATASSSTFFCQPLLHPALFFVKRLMRSARGSLGATSAESLMEDALATPMMRRHAAPEGERGATEREIVHAQDPT